MNATQTRTGGVRCLGQRIEELLKGGAIGGCRRAQTGQLWRSRGWRGGLS